MRRIICLYLIEGSRSSSRSCNSPSPSCGGFSCSGSSTKTTSCSKDCTVDWEGWGGWSTCECAEANSVEGIRTRSRHCPNPYPSTGESPCPGDSKQTEGCTLTAEDCTVDWAEWGPWSTCLCEEANSSEGTRSRSRTCPNPYPSTGESPCPGDSNRTEGCTKNCTFADCLTLNPAWNMTNMSIDTDLPIENGMEMALSCPSPYFLSGTGGSNVSTCQNGILTAIDIPACLRIPYWSGWYQSEDGITDAPRNKSLCTNLTFNDGDRKTYYSCAYLLSRICYHEVKERSCIGPAEKVEKCYEWICTNSGFTHGYGAIVLVLIVKFFVQ
ncbi:coadhesin-like [Bolinopsis microptera]|uniref:coadhesin-like n=1 Tax=Bolinopsis microptera TaxID=2820187 RepID=UPI0030796E5C